MADALERVGCADLAHRSYNTLSGGEKQRALIARAVAQGADHLILDEPTNHLDIRYQLEVLELVAGLGVTVLAALHDLSLAALFCDQAYLMADGRIVTGGPPAQVITAETVRHAYGADVLVIDHPDTATPHLIPRRRARAPPGPAVAPPTGPAPPRSRSRRNDKNPPPLFAHGQLPAGSTVRKDTRLTTSCSTVAASRSDIARGSSVPAAAPHRRGGQSGALRRTVGGAASPGRTATAAANGRKPTPINTEAEQPPKRGAGDRQH